MIPLGPVVARARVGAPRVAVWEFLTDPKHRADWWAELRLDPVVGGGIAEHRDIEGDEAGRDVAGEVDVLVKGHAIGFTWHEGDERDTSVLLTLRSYGDETGITITETGFDGLPNPAEKAAAALSDWEGLLGELSSTVEQAVADGFVVEEIVVVEEPTADEGESVEAGLKRPRCRRMLRRRQRPRCRRRPSCPTTSTIRSSSKPSFDQKR